jgi:uncharacterized protein
MSIFDAHTHWNASWNADPHDPAEWLSVWDRHGIARGAVCPLAGLLSDDRLSDDNRDLAAACARSGGRMFPLASVNPSSAGAVDELRRLIHSLPLAGVKLHPWLQGASLTSAPMDEIVELAGEHRLPVLVHDGTPPFSLPSQVALLARRHPRTTFVLGHCGIFEHWREAIASLRATENLWGCVCSPYPAAVREILSRADVARLVWGSDHGFGPRDRIGYHLAVLDQAKLTDAQRTAILWDNPGRLFQSAALA